MIRSMTGYGRGEWRDAERRVVVEIRAVNHRYGDIQVRLPRELTALEERIRKVMQSEVSRGRVEVTLSISGGARAGKSVSVDKNLAEAYYKALKELAEVLGARSGVSIEQLASLPGVVSVEEEPESPDAWWPAVEAALRAALETFIAMREAEGRHLTEDMARSVKRLEDWVEEIALQAPKVVEAYRERLAQRVAELAAEVDVDENRLATEVALFADRVDINEEIVRLTSHLRRLHETLTGTGPVGRKMDFVLQEVHREFNTIGSKANDSEIAGIVVEAKGELERLREQAQNIE